MVMKGDLKGKKKRETHKGIRFLSHYISVNPAISHFTTVLN